MAINRTKQARQMLNNAGAVEQDGVMNYIKNSDSVTVPKEFKARGNAPSTKLAYITADEAKMLKKQKPGTPHKGPKGIPSYDSFDAEGGFTSGAAMSAAETGSSNARDRAEVRAAFGPKGLPPGVTPNEARDLRSSVIAAGAGRRVNPGFFDSRNVISLSSFIKPEDTIGRVDLNDLEGLSELDFLGRTNLNDYEGILEDEGLTVAPGSIIDEGLLEVPADLIDQGLLEVPSDFIDQGEIIALANGGRINAMDGGLMNLDGARQMMFIGGIAKAAKKAVKKVTRGVKKIAKSPLGKAALLGAGLYFTRGTGGGILEKFNNLKPFQKALFGIGATSALAGLTTPKEEDEEIDLEEYYKQAMINPNAPLSRRILGTEFAANGGRIGYAEGSKEPVAKKVMPLLDMDGMEKDYRADGGFVPIGRMEKADDVPARLSKNEFVFTADAVRNAGGGDVDKGSEVMYNMMKNLEAGGEISEESQGLEGAREMFQTSQRLGEVI